MCLVYGTLTEIGPWWSRYELKRVTILFRELLA